MSLNRTQKDIRKPYLNARVEKLKTDDRLQMVEKSDPVTNNDPDFASIYPKDDNNLYYKDINNNEVLVAGGGGAGIFMALDSNLFPNQKRSGNEANQSIGLNSNLTQISTTETGPSNIGLVISSEQATAFANYVSIKHQDDPTEAGNLSLVKSRGTEAVPTAVQANDEISKIFAIAHNGTGYEVVGLLRFDAKSNQTPTNADSKFVVALTPTNAVVPDDAFIFDNDASLAIREDTAPPALANFGKIYVKSSDSQLYFKDSSGIEHVLSGPGIVDTLQETYDSSVSGNILLNNTINGLELQNDVGDSINPVFRCHNNADTSDYINVSKGSFTAQNGSITATGTNTPNICIGDSCDISGLNSNNCVNIGSNNICAKPLNVAIGNNIQATANSGTLSTNIGYNLTNTKCGDRTINIGESNVINTNLSPNDSQNHTIAIGDSHDIIHNFATDAFNVVSVGVDNHFQNMRNNTSVGMFNETFGDSEDCTVVGIQNQFINNCLRDIIVGQSTRTQDTTDCITIGNRCNNNGGQFNHVIGSENDIFTAITTTTSVFGHNNSVLWDGNSYNGIVIGADNTINNTVGFRGNNYIYGCDNNITEADFVNCFGYQNTITDNNNRVNVIGYNNTMNNGIVDTSVLGYNNQITGDNSFIAGLNHNITGNNNFVFGESVTSAVNYANIININNTAVTHKSSNSFSVYNIAGAKDQFRTVDNRNLANNNGNLSTYVRDVTIPSASPVVLWTIDTSDAKFRSVSVNNSFHVTADIMVYNDTANSSIVESIRSVAVATWRHDTLTLAVQPIVNTSLIAGDYGSAPTWVVNANSLELGLGNDGVNQYRAVAKIELMVCNVATV